MKILLINPPIRLRYLPYIHPVGLASVAASLRNDGHDVDILDLNTIRNNVPLPNKDYKLIGISGLITTYRFVKLIVPQIRAAYPGVPIVMGGGGFSSAPEVYFDSLDIDYGVVGEGERGAVRLANAIECGSDVPKIITSPLEKNLDSFPDPAYDLLDLDTYLRVVKYAPHGTREAAFFCTRGCPFDCNYCYHIFDRGIRYRSVERVIAEMELLKSKYKVDSLLMADECFMTKKAWVRDMCAQMIERQLNFEWMCYSRVDTVDEETLSIMARAGCLWIGFGLESGSPTMLKYMNKRTTPEKMLDAIKLAKKYMGVRGTLIFGYPGETDETVEENLEFCKEAVSKGVSSLTLFYLQPYPGTQVYNQYKDQIVHKMGDLPTFFSKLDDAGKFVINLTDWSDAEAFYKWHTAMDSIAKLYGRYTLA